MRRSRNHNFSQRLPTIIAFLLSFTACAGLAQSESNPVKIKWGAYEGHAAYDYTVDGRDTILNGSFQFNGPIVDTFTLEQRTYTSIKGHFSNNKPIDDWQFNQSTVLGLGKTRFDETYLKINTQAKTHRINGSFDFNQDTLTWRHDIIAISSEQELDSIFAAAIEIRTGLNKLLTIKSSDCQLIGYVDGTNSADSTWNWLPKNDTAYIQWQFEKGLLTEITSGETTWLVDSEEKASAAAKVNVLPLSKEYIDILSLKLALVGYDSSTEACVSTLYTLDSLEKVRKEFFETLDQTYTIPLTFKLPYYKPSNSEKANLDSVAVFYANMDALFDEIYGVTEPELLKKNFPEVAAILDTVDLLYLKEFDAVKQMNELHKAEVTSYVNLDRLTAYIIDNNKTFDSTENDSLFNLQSFITHTKLAQLKLNDFKARLIELSDIRQKQRSLLALEKKMLDKHAILKMAIDSALRVTPLEYASGIDAILSFSNNLTQQYWATPTMLEKLILAEKNQSCFDDLIALTHLMYKLPSEVQRIKELYIESDFNIFTATDIEYVEKKRIVEAYTKRIIPYFYNTLLQEVSCENAVAVYNTISESTQRMHEIKEEETYQIEKRLANQLSIAEILNLLRIN